MWMSYAEAPLLLRCILYKNSLSLGHKNEGKRHCRNLGSISLDALMNETYVRSFQTNFLFGYTSASLFLQIFVVVSGLCPPPLSAHHSVRVRAPLPFPASDSQRQLKRRNSVTEQSRNGGNVCGGPKMHSPEMHPPNWTAALEVIAPIPSILLTRKRPTEPVHVRTRRTFSE